MTARLNTICSYHFSFMYVCMYVCIYLFIYLLCHVLRHFLLLLRAGTHTKTLIDKKTDINDRHLLIRLLMPGGLLSSPAPAMTCHPIHNGQKSFRRAWTIL